MGMNASHSSPSEKSVGNDVEMIEHKSDQFNQANGNSNSKLQ